MPNMAALRLLAVAVSSRRVGYVFFSGNRLMTWKMAVKPITAPKQAGEWFQALIDRYKPDVVVTEKLDDDTTRKGKRSRSLTKIFARVAAQNYLLDVLIKPEREYANKYEQATALARFYPDIGAWVPQKRKFYDPEPQRMVLFDALAIANAVMQRPSFTLASAMR